MSLIPRETVPGTQRKSRAFEWKANLLEGSGANIDFLLLLKKPWQTGSLSSRKSLLRARTQAVKRASLS